MAARGERGLNAGRTPEHYVDGLGAVCSERKYMRLDNPDNTDDSTEGNSEGSPGLRLLAQPTLRADSHRSSTQNSQTKHGQGVGDHGEKHESACNQETDTLVYDSQTTNINSDAEDDDMTLLISDDNVQKVVDFLIESDSPVKKKVEKDNLEVSEHVHQAENNNNGINQIEGGVDKNDTDFETQIIEDEVDGSSKPVPMEKIFSVQSDAEKISELLGRADVVSLYERLKARRSDPQRLEKVTNEVLEEEGAAKSKSENCDISHKSTCDNPNSQQPSTSTDVKSVVADISAVSKELKKHHPEVDIDPNEIYMRLESVINLPDRVDKVVQTLLEEQRDLKSRESPACAEDDIFQQVQRVLLKCPEADANRVFNLLEVFSEETNRIDKVIDHLKKKNKNNDIAAQNSNNKSNQNQGNEPGSSTGTNANTKPPVRTADSFKNDPLYKDMQQLAKIFPDRREEEIYAHLEVYHNKPNRMELVMEEFLGSNNSQPETPINKTTQPSLDFTPHDVTDGGGPSTSADTETDIVLLKFKSDLELLKAVFTEAEPAYLVEQLQEHFQFAGRVDMITAIMINQPNYPKLKVKPRIQEQRNRLENLPLDIPEFLKLFPNPQEVFYDETKAMDKLYKEHAKVKLYTEFRAWSTEYLDRRLKNHNYHYLPAYREIQNDMLLMGEKEVFIFFIFLKLFCIKTLSCFYDLMI